MKQHTTIGARILGKFRTGFIKLAEVIALTHHHERWDGSGYPQGLRGVQIPLISTGRNIEFPGTIEGWK